MSENYSEETLIISSRDLAIATGRDHRNVLRDIRKEISTLQEDLEKLDLNVPEQAKYAHYMSKTLKGFRESSYKDSMNREQVEILMDSLAASQLSLGHSPAIRCYILGSLFDREEVSNSHLIAKFMSNVLPRSPDFRYVYIIENTETGRIKVGVSADPEKRLKRLQTTNDCSLELVYTSSPCSNAFNVESAVHQKFQNHLVRGEWFDVPVPEVVKFLDQHRESFPNHR